MSTAGKGNRKLKAKCFCGSVHFMLDVSPSHLPLHVHLCHCSYCHYRLGAPCVFHFKAPKDAALRYIAPSSTAKVSRYTPLEASGAGVLLERGCHIFDESLSEDGRLAPSSSIFEDQSDAVFQIKRHIYSHSAKDGGPASCMSPNINSRLIEDWNHPKEGQPDAKIVESRQEHHADGTKRLRVQCHCGGVSFTFTRPTADMVADTEHFAKSVSPVDPAKWRATWDVCSDCRLVNGTHVVGWTYIPRILCDPPIARDLKIGTLRVYASSPDVQRSFCTTCGATVFFTHADRCPSDEKQIVNVATGLLRAPEGTMAEDWLTWKSSLSHPDNGRRFDTGFFDALAAGMRTWTTQRYGRELDFIIPRKRYM
ncbi:Glutathione-dependent formaldehyde-activating enzyme [Geosmithia morbida]|uniref:Glutathione-dependent formaldehyde-activating enzyme n=1 Tax=Geosmithia morbida TaxID=1094350 RepID=A0A9P4YYX7_9HYPO|nr:Glutathione-dependent formaldehyde-activating enzyme [Geosmithia morbida]KAF4125082.1 Glutathione-dependent formaldehyde-activating enzyme [Geosmithia morbida]